MNVLIFRLRFPQAIPHRSTVVQERVNQDRGRKHECDEVGHGVGRRQVQRGVLFVRRDIQRHVGSDDTIDVVRTGEPIPGGIGCQRKVARLPDLEGADRLKSGRGQAGVVRSLTHVIIVDDRHQNPVEKHESDKDVYFCPPGNHQRGTDVGDLIPVKVDKAHAQARHRSKELVDNEVVGNNPADETKVRESGEKES